MNTVWPAPSKAEHPQSPPETPEPHRIPSTRAVRSYDVLLVPAAAFALLLLGALVLKLLERQDGAPTLFPAPDAAWTMHALAGLLYGATIAAALALLLLRRVPFAEAGWRRLSPGWVALTFGIWAIYIALFGGLNLWLNQDGLEFIEEQNRAMVQGANLFLALAVLGILAPVAEEIYFRGILFGWLKRHLGVFSSALLTSIAFALVHTNYLMEDMTATLLAMAQIGTLGFIAALLYHRTGSLIPAILLHMTNNLAVTLVTAAAP